MDALQDAWPQRGSAVAPIETHPPSEGAARRTLGAVGFMADSVRRRRSGRLTLWALVVGLTMGGLWLLAYPVVTDIWADRIQNGLENEFQALEQSGGANADGYDTVPATGKALTRLRIPHLGLSVIVVEGVTGSALRAGAGHFPDTALPGAKTGNVVIAGHRTGYGEPFLELDELTKGHQVILDTPFGTYVYKVIGPFDGHGNPWIIPPTDLTVKGHSAQPVLTLITCDPPNTSKNRLVVRAALFREIPK